MRFVLRSLKRNATATGIFEDPLREWSVAVIVRVFFRVFLSVPTLVAIHRGPLWDLSHCDQTEHEDMTHERVQCQLSQPVKGKIFLRLTKCSQHLLGLNLFM